MNNQKQDDGSEGAKAAIAVIFMIGLLIGVYYALRAGKKKDEGGDGDAAGPVTGGGLSQTQTQVIPPGADVDLAPNTPFTNNWAAVIDAVGSILLDRLRQTLEDRLRGDADANARAADARAADADARANAARAAADAGAKARTDAEARSQIEAEKARAEGRSVDASNRTVNDLDADGRPPPPPDADGRPPPPPDADGRPPPPPDADGRPPPPPDADGRPPPPPDADGRPPPPDADGTARGVIASENVNAMAAEEEFARTSAEEGVRPSDARRSVVPEVRSAMADKVQSLEGEARKGANKVVGDLDAADARAADAKADAATRSAAASENAKAMAQAEADARARAEADARAQADFDARALANANAADALRRQTRNALDVDAKAAAEEKVRTKAAEIANLDKPRPPSLLARLAKNSARGPLGSAETTKIVEMGEPTRNPDTGRIDVETPDPTNQLRTHPLDYNGPRSSSWGKMPSEVMKRSGQYMRDVGAKLQRSMAKKPTTPLEADTKAMVDSKVMARSAGTSAAKQAGMAVVDVIGKIDFASDLMMIVQVFCDAFFYKAFPDESTLITPKTVKGIQEKSVKAQIDSTTLYNEVVDDINATLVDYSYARSQWPVIIGPLDDPTEHTLKVPRSVASKYPEYENQQRVQAEVDAVREKLLRTTRTTGTDFKAYWISCFGQAAYTDVTSNVADALVNYVEKEPFEDPTIAGIGKYTKSDELYREAFTSVCRYHGGVVYEDVRPAADPNWGGRPRFQCSWANPDLCEASASNWIDTNGSNGDNYGEWYTFDELNVTLANITEAPPTGKGIVGCHGTDTSTYRNACGIEASHPLRQNGKTGACIISTPAVASICKKNAGTYVSAEHRCVFSEEYCQSLGTCFDRTEKMCYLPGEAMFAVSMVFGTGGPREWIKVNGCNFASSPTDGFYDIINVTPLGLFTKQGQTFMADMLANHENWGEGMKQTLGNPVMAATIAGMAVMFAIGSEKGGKLIGKGLSKAGVDVTGEKGQKRVGRAQTGVGFLLMAVAIGIAIGFTVLESQEEQNKGPPDPEYGPYASEYTVGGWKDNIGTSPPMTLGFNDGWVTKPLKVHTLAGWPQTLSPSKKIPTLTYITENVQDIPANVSEKRFYEAYDLDGWLTFHANDMSKAVKSYTSTLKPPVNKKLCYTDNKIRAGARATDNQLFCMDPFPPAAYRDNLNIGELAPDEALEVTDTSRSYMTSRTWTDGKDPTTPQYPFDAVKDNSPDLWYYQLVYDKHNMVGMTSVTEDGVTYKKGYPTALWNTELLQFYFLDSTIQEMRQYYCIQGLIDKPDGSFDATTKIGVDPKCWGYLNVAVPGYKYTPMTLPGLAGTSATAQAVLTATAPVAAPPAPTASDIAKSIPSPMITVFKRTNEVGLALQGAPFGSTLSDAQITTIGLDPTKKPVKVIDISGYWTAIISPTQQRTISSSELVWGDIEVLQTTATGTWPTATRGRNPDLVTIIGRLNLSTLLAS